MTKYLIRGGKPLHGTIEISGAKNAAVAILPAALLVDGVCRIENIPQISDVTLILKILQERYRDRRILIDIEELDPDAENSLEREKRMDFYIRSGFVSAGVFYRFYGVDYELLSCHGRVKKEDFQRLVQRHWGPAAKNAVYREK